MNFNAQERINLVRGGVDDIYQVNPLTDADRVPAEGAVCEISGLFLPANELLPYDRESIRLGRMLWNEQASSKRSTWSYNALHRAMQDVKSFYSYSTIDEFIDYALALYELYITNGLPEHDPVGDAEHAAFMDVLDSMW